MEVMKKTFGVIGVVLVAVAIISLSVNFGFASQNGINGSNKTTVTKTFELPSRLHKNGEGFYEIGRMLTPRYKHSSILLQDGRVFIVGGEDNKGRTLNSTEIFNPKTGKSIKGPDMPYSGFECTLKLLSNGNVLIVGGQYNNQDKVSVYIPKENKIVETNKTLTNKIIRSAVIAEISNDEVFIDDSSHVAMKSGFGIYNKQTNKLSIKYPTLMNYVRFDHYIDNIKNELYFLSVKRGIGSKKAVLNIVELIPTEDSNKYTLQDNRYELDSHPPYDETSHGIFLKDGKTLFIHNDDNDCYILFDTLTKKIKKVKPNVKLNAIHNLSLLENGNLIFFNLSKNSINIIELNPYNGSGFIKQYSKPEIYNYSVINLDGNNLLFTGGAKVHPAGLITFSYSYGASDKIYLWKTKKENN